MQKLAIVFLCLALGALLDPDLLLGQNVYETTAIWAVAAQACLEAQGESITLFPTIDACTAVRSLPHSTRRLAISY